MAMSKKEQAEFTMMETRAIAAETKAEACERQRRFEGVSYQATIHDLRLALAKALKGTAVPAELAENQVVGTVADLKVLAASGVKASYRGGVITIHSGAQS